MGAFSKCKQRGDAALKGLGAKVWLEEFGECHNKLNLMLDRYEDMESKLTSPRSTALDGMPHSQGSTSDIIGKGIVRLEELREKIDRISEQEQQLYEERDAIIERISGKGAAIMQTILRYRYFDLLPWSEVNRIVYGSKPDFDDRMESYLRMVYYNHKRGIEAVQAILDKE
ncbi:MAG: hypothetical protein ACI3V0_08540 [Faecousia sp.]